MKEIVFTVRVLQMIALPLLGMKPLILYFPSHPSAFNHFCYIPLPQGQVRKKPKCFSDLFCLPLFLPFPIASDSLFSIFHQTDRISSVINSGYVIIPARAIFQLLLPALLFHSSKLLIFLCNPGNAPILISQDISPLLTPTFSEKPLTYIQTVRTYTDSQPRKCLFQFLHQTPAGFSLTVLFPCLLSFFVFYEFCHDAFDDIRMQYKLRFQNIIIVFPVFIGFPL